MFFSTIEIIFFFKNSKFKMQELSVHSLRIEILNELKDILPNSNSDTLVLKSDLN